MRLPGDDYDYNYDFDNCNYDNNDYNYDYDYYNCDDKSNDKPEEFEEENNILIRKIMIMIMKYDYKVKLTIKNQPGAFEVEAALLLLGN